MDKRTFLKNAGLMGLAAPLSLAHVKSVVAAAGTTDPWQLAGDEGHFQAVAVFGDRHQAVALGGDYCLDGPVIEDQ